MYCTSTSPGLRMLSLLVWKSAVLQRREDIPSQPNCGKSRTWHTEATSAGVNIMCSRALIKSVALKPAGRGQATSILSILLTACERTALCKLLIRKTSWAAQLPNSIQELIRRVVTDKPRAGDYSSNLTVSMPGCQCQEASLAAFSFLFWYRHNLWVPPMLHGIEAAANWPSLWELLPVGRTERSFFAS